MSVADLAHRGLEAASRAQETLLFLVFTVAGAAVGVVLASIPAVKQLAPLLTSKDGLNKLIHGSGVSASHQSAAYAKRSLTPEKQAVLSGHGSPAESEKIKATPYLAEVEPVPDVPAAPTESELELAEAPAKGADKPAAAMVAAPATPMTSPRLATHDLTEDETETGTEDTESTRDTESTTAPPTPTHTTSVLLAPTDGKKKKKKSKLTKALVKPIKSFGKLISGDLSAAQVK